MFKLTILIVVLSQINAQIPIPEVGECISSPVVSDFDVTKV